MASNIPTGSKRPRDPSVQGLKVKFLINIPLKVDSVAQAQNRFGYLLSKLQTEGFKEEDTKFMKKKNGEEVLEDVAVIFGMNGKHTPERAKDLEALKSSRHDCNIQYSIITYTWGEGGTIAQDVPKGVIPYRDIREHLKNHSATRELVEELRGNYPKCLVYFSFVDSDTFKFNYIYSEYLQIVREELKKDNIPPTVMSTGYEFSHDSEHFMPSWLDREVRVAVAEVHPLLVYYPEPNFCVLVCEGSNTIEESFIQKGRRKGEYSMEAPVLIRQLKNRQDFKAVFPYKNPIIIEAPERFRVSADKTKTNQSHLIDMNLATGAMSNMILENKEKKVGQYRKNRGFIMKLFNCKDEKEFEEKSKENPFRTSDGKEATVLIDAVREAREYRMFVEDMVKKEKDFSEKI